MPKENLKYFDKCHPCYFKYYVFISGFMDDSFFNDKTESL